MKIGVKKASNVVTVVIALFLIVAASSALISNNTKTESELIKWTIVYPESYRIVDSIYSCHTGEDRAIKLELSCIDSEGKNVMIVMEKEVDKTPDMIDLEPAKVSGFSIKEGFYNDRGHR